MTGAGDGTYLQTSRYNFCLPLASGFLLYNARTGASLRYASDAPREFLDALCRYPARVAAEDIAERTRDRLQRGGFLVETGFDELLEIRGQYLHAKIEAPVIVTITTTNDCNLGCFYCFQKRDASQLQNGRIDQIVDHIRAIFAQSHKRTLHVDWYGGEPMLNRDFLEKASVAIQDACHELDVSYSASILTNGTLWPEDALSFVKTHHIERLQITFDGMSRSHNKTRRHRTVSRENVNQFDAACALVDQLAPHISVDIRFNLSRQNAEEATEFAELGLARGWFAPENKAQLQLAKLTPYSTEVDFLRKVEFTFAEFEEVRNRVRPHVPDGKLDKSASLDSYPSPRESVCAAIAEDSIVIGADGNLYSCGLQVTEPHRNVGQLGRAHTESALHELQFWDGFDPTRAPSCSRCSFLPLCWGSCPKLHMECDTAQLEQQSEFWRVMLPRRLAASLDLSLVPGFALTAVDQFRG
ncbi:radical SAM protein [Mesorhizobium sp. CU2]|uniref:radical SAM/SPASM domain-containing protein n=1 Tax=unclassified Mesorhizobium TaxID=325217 RepID=UPI00112C2E51|nr:MULTISPECIES: radical SAM protein [unclassified Mesorhizobium]TPN82560.1 radical SAM protein [Mesorhizobium sp. CU3]TPO12765.1 radical SAM protein [Mesorhizobium sp. CU2]